MDTNEDGFTCVTCSESFDETGVSKHLISTRHKSVRSNIQDEIIVCEECEDSNIHQLAISRYGLSDMSLLCQVCFDKEKSVDEEKPSTQYTLSNGAFFSKIKSYYKFRDIECKDCQSGSNLFVGNGSGPKQIIVCQRCLPRYPDIKFVSEKDEKFLFELLGIKESTPSKHSGRHRKEGRKGGRKSSRKPKVVTAEMEARRAHYFASKESASALKSGTTVKAIGSNASNSPFAGAKGGASPSRNASNPSFKASSQSGGTSKKTTPKSSLSNSRQATPKSSLNNSVAPTPRSSSPATSKSKGSGKEKRALDPKKAATAKPNEKNVKTTKTEENGTKKITSNGTKSNGEAFKTASIPNTEKTKKSQETSLLSDKTSKLKKGIEDGKSKGSGSAKENKLVDKASRRETKMSKDKEQHAAQSNSPKNKSINNELQEAKSSGAKNKNSEKKKSVTEPKPDKKKVQEENTENHESELPQELTKFHPASKAKLKYESLDSYFREMSFNMFLEEQLTNDDNSLTSEDILIEWFEDQDKKNIQYKLSIPLSDDITKKFISEKLRNVKKTPFAIGQSMFLILNDEVPWYGTIATLDTAGGKKGGGRGRGGRARGRGGRGGRGGRSGGSGSKDAVLEMIIQLYSWNDHPLPRASNVSQLKVLPASVPVSRVFVAMSRLSNVSFKKMLLGNEPIKQIVFKNFLKFTRDTFNESQKVAIQSVLNNAITVLQGPPGTGKTSTIFEIILQLLDSLNTYPILVVAASNIAIDNIAEKLLPTHGKHILRIVANEKEREYNRSHPLGSICLHHKVYDSLPSRYQEVINEMRRGTLSLGATAFKKFSSEQFEVTKTLVAQARVIFTTTVVAGGNQLKSIARCPVVIMDEATQSSEPTTLIPLSMPGVEKFVFVGDQRQLSCFSLIPSLSLSLFERVLLTEIYKNPHMLDTQYRMHPQISDFPRNRFYGGLLKDGIEAKDRHVTAIHDPVYFWDTKGKAREQSVRHRLREDRGFTYVNREEINYIAQVLRTLIYEKNIKKTDIGIITPYSGQRDLISSILVKDELINPDGDQIKIEIDIDDIRNDSKPITIHLVSGIMIASIDAFQGREKDFLVMSCVRSNPEGKIGFLKDERRLNVALTRAKFGLVMIGDVSCLKRGDPLWKEYMKYLQDKKYIHSESVFKY
ncbi:P-loop containing nucleoside triphosphate hydrolase protein [Scheffersomyces xylosifermentans]|uniref:P-loop containing nucleoside triphosphate hydrolase protein n=1 Tax=Scheffersomyces xylosifermentans TaxID=1304137 RepID=UPI00315CFF6E